MLSVLISLGEVCIKRLVWTKNWFRRKGSKDRCVSFPREFIVDYLYECICSAKNEFDAELGEKKERKEKRREEDNFFPL